MNIVLFMNSVKKDFENDEEGTRCKEQAVLDLGQLYSKHGKAAELAHLIKYSRPFLSMISKAKAAKLVKALVDLFLDMEAGTGSEVHVAICCSLRRGSFIHFLITSKSQTRKLTQIKCSSYTLGFMQF